MHRRHCLAALALTAGAALATREGDERKTISPGRGRSA